VRLVMLSAAYLGILTSSTVGIFRAYGDYSSFVKTVVVNNAMHSSSVHPAVLKRQAEMLTRHNKGRHYGQHGLDSTILLLMGLGMSGLALWGSRRSPAA